MIYAGIGSRKTPKEVLLMMNRMGNWLAKRGDILRSGHADGADFGFEEGCTAANGEMEIYLPWEGFNRSSSEYYLVEVPYNSGCFFLHTPDDNYVDAKRADDMVCRFHPDASRLSPAAYKLMMRNGFQVLGANLDTSADFVLCYTKEGKMIGGTAQALRIAEAHGIPVFNLGSYMNEKTGEFRKEDVTRDFNTFYKSVQRSKEAEIER